LKQPNRVFLANLAIGTKLNTLAAVGKSIRDRERSPKNCQEIEYVQSKDLTKILMLIENVTLEMMKKTTTELRLTQILMQK
jgi:hypothetical protein